MTITIQLRRNSDKRVVSYESTVDDKYKDTFLFCWSEGNFSCDCNRRAFFNRADGVVVDNEDFIAVEDLIPCSDGQYGVIITHNGNELYRDYWAD